jgi:hypothetical protein
MQQLTPQLENGPSWQSAAILGIIAGFAERLIPSIMRWTTEQLEPSFGTPSQAVRAEEMLTSKQVRPPADTEAQDVKAKGTSQTSRKITAPV